MKKSWFGTLWLVLCFTLTGCVGISIGNRGSAPRSTRTTPAPLPAAASSDSATLAEIDAANTLNMDSNRTEALLQIANRENLSPTAQVHLVNSTYRSLNFDSSKVRVLKGVIANPAFCDPARQAVVSQLELISMESNRRAILDEVNRRMAAK
jgi:hypothetical protein